MRTQRINRVSSVVLILLSLTALVTVVTGLIWPPPMPESDEGTQAHIFQLSIAALLPMTIVVLGTADWLTLAPCTWDGAGIAPRRTARVPLAGTGAAMPDSVYRVTQVIGTSTDSWEAAARNAVETAARTVRDLRVAEVEKLDVTIENGRVTAYRARLNISFKYETGD